ncbi:MAG TPA: acylphosphatase [Burkholderiaceae bacterium]
MTSREQLHGDPAPGPIECRLARVHGRVQGVGFRETCVQQARALGVTGWVRNRLDGSVEAMLQGTPAQLEAMCEWLRDGNPVALVDELELRAVPPPFARADGFERLPTL